MSSRWLDLSSIWSRRGLSHRVLVVVSSSRMGMPVPEMKRKRPVMELRKTEHPEMRLSSESSSQDIEESSPSEMDPPRMKLASVVPKMKTSPKEPKVVPLSQMDLKKRRPKEMSASGLLSSWSPQPEIAETGGNILKSAMEDPPRDEALSEPKMELVMVQGWL
jgi:hypothetical protein